jgi:hypothetical protein
MTLDKMRELLTDFLAWQDEHDCYAADALEPYLDYRQDCALMMGDDLSGRAHVESGVSRPARSTKVRTGETDNATRLCQCGHRRDEHKDWIAYAACKKCGCLMFKLPAGQ